MKGTFRQFNEEINEFYKYLQENKYSDEEIQKIFKPILRQPQKTKLTALVLIGSAFTFLYLATYMETVSWHLSAIGRILLIKLLPIYDWTMLKNEKCLLPKPHPQSQPPIFNCDLCENVKIDIVEDISADLLKDKYLDIDLPVIVQKSWSFEPSDVMSDDVIGASKPCNLATNVHKHLPSVKTLLHRTALFDSFFMHFQNCDFEAMKRFRAFTPRLSFVPVELSPVQYNWLIWSRDYNVTQYKEIRLVDKVAVVGQIKGGNEVRLVARANCREECPVVDVVLREGESLVVGALWSVEYRPEWGENVAVVLEMH